VIFVSQNPHSSVDDDFDADNEQIHIGSQKQGDARQAVAPCLTHITGLAPRRRRG
jgi:hypothetical protein